MVKKCIFRSKVPWLRRPSKRRSLRGRFKRSRRPNPRKESRNWQRKMRRKWRIPRFGKRPKRSQQPVPKVNPKSKLQLVIRDKADPAPSPPRVEADQPASLQIPAEANRPANLQTLVDPRNQFHQILARVRNPHLQIPWWKKWKERRHEN